MVQHRRTALLALAAVGFGLAAASPAWAHPEGGRSASGLVHPPHRLTGGRAGIRMVLPFASQQTGPDYPGALWEPASPANYTVANRPYDLPIHRIIIHVAEGGFEPTYTWFRNPAAQASANYVVGYDGEIAQMVPEHDIAWHAGNWAYNETSVGIEHAGFTDKTIFPDTQYRASARLAAYLADKYQIVPDRSHVIGHYQVPDPFHPGQFGGADHHTDPGHTWNWPLYMAYLRADAHDTYQQVVDNSTPDGVSYSSAVWKTSSASPDHQGPNYLFTAGRTAGHPVAYRFHVPAADRYDVFMRWPCNAAYNRRVTVGVAVQGGYRSLTVNESRDCTRGWNWLGSWPLAAGTGTKLVVLSSSPDPGNIVADAFRIVEASDPTPPSAPAVTLSGVQATSMHVAWTAAHDSIGVGAYQLWVGGSQVYLGTGLAADVQGLRCGLSYTVSVRAVDLAGNRSPKHALEAVTPACPTLPTGLVAGTPTQTGVSLSWDHGGPTVTGYNVYLNGVRVAQTGSAGYSYTGLTCGTAYALGVAGFDAAGDVSAHAHIDVQTAAC
jgi:N-acetylmuramoyl-L-alanine amidase